MSSRSGKATEVIRVTPYVRAILDSHITEEKIKSGSTQLTYSDALQQILEKALPTHVAKVLELRPDLAPEGKENGNEKS